MSTQRHCRIYLATDRNWYMELGDFEHAGPADSTVYGPFASEEGAVTELDRHSNPGGYDIDDSAEDAPPKNAVKTTSRSPF